MNTAEMTYRNFLAVAPVEDKVKLAIVVARGKNWNSTKFKMSTLWFAKQKQKSLSEDVLMQLELDSGRNRFSGR